MDVFTDQFSIRHIQNFKIKINFLFFQLKILIRICQNLIMDLRTRPPRTRNMRRELARRAASTCRHERGPVGGGARCGAV